MAGHANKNQSPGETLLKCLPLVEGAYSLALLTQDSLIAVRDPLGFRPLVLGKKEEAFIVASETCALDLIGARYVREIRAGEILIINKKGIKSLYLPKAKKKGAMYF